MVYPRRLDIVLCAVKFVCVCVCVRANVHVRSVVFDSLQVHGLYNLPGSSVH